PALNIGLKQAKGKYIARMDGDDISMPNRFELQVSFLDENPDIAVVGGAMDIINERGERTSHRKYATTPFKARMFALMRSPLAHPTVMMHHRIIDDGFFYDNEFSKAEDLELWLRLMNNGYKISNMSNTILSYRVIGDLSTKRTKEHFKFAYKARKKNFTFRYPIWNVISVLISKFNSILPNKIVSIAYKIENKQNNNH
ncbi:MAG: glycosyltransferase, partial [Prevotellaceae bacterium]|nr:glycosyltransferase [Prevotellaceae bacterium]